MVALLSAENSGGCFLRFRLPKHTREKATCLEEKYFAFAILAIIYFQPLLERSLFASPDLKRNLKGREGTGRFLFAHLLCEKKRYLGS